MIQYISLHFHCRSLIVRSGNIHIKEEHVPLYYYYYLIFSVFYVRGVIICRLLHICIIGNNVKLVCVFVKIKFTFVQLNRKCMWQKLWVTESEYVSVVDRVPLKLNVGRKSTVHWILGSLENSNFILSKWIARGTFYVIHSS